jgi:long-chain acyl-CoA synthetase
MKLAGTTVDLLKTNRTFRDIYETAVTIHGLEPAVIYFDEDGKKQTYNYEKYKTKTYYLARKMSTCFSSLPPRSIVALKIRNRPEWPHLFWAIMMTNHVPLLIDAKLPHENTENLLRQAKAKAIIANEEEPYSVDSFRMNKISAAEDDFSFQPNWADEVIFCSSGTTGDAKMMVQTGSNMCAQLASCRDFPKENQSIIVPGRTRIFAMIPFHHIFGFTAVFLWYTFFGKTIVYPSSNSTRDMMTAIRKGKVTHLYSVPLFWDSVAQNILRTAALKGPKRVDFLMRMINFWNGDISGREAGMAAWPMFRTSVQKKVLGKDIMYCISGGGYLNENTMRVINGIGYPLHNGFGMTEVGVTSVDLSERIEDRLKGSIGRPSTTVEYKLMPIKGGKKGQGELYIKCPFIHTEEIVGGKRRPTELVDGFFPSGDICEKDATGMYYVKGRLKDAIINANGENVYPDEIEFYFKNVRHVANSVVLGVKKKDSNDEDIVLVLELDNAVTEADFPEIKSDVDKINASLPTEKRVTKAYIYKKSLPISNNMKVRRFILKDALEKGQDDFISFEEGAKEAKISNALRSFDEDEVKETIEEVKKVFSKTLLLPTFKIDENADFGKDLGGDSMSYVTMVDDLNHAFHVSIDQEKYGKLLTVNDFALEILTIKAEKEGKKRKDGDKKAKKAS